MGSALAWTVERIVEPVEGMHRTIAGHWVTRCGPASRKAESSHGGISSLVYGLVRVGATVLGAGLDTAMTHQPQTAQSFQAFVNGLWGDRLDRLHDDLATPMRLCGGSGTPVPIGPGVAAAFPEASGRLVVLVHGLARTERCWSGTDHAPGLARSLAAHPAFTPLSVRYNTGLPISVSGARLGALLEELAGHWPVQIDSIALVGHSMGGLVAATAAQASERAKHRWFDNLTDVVTIGSPHRGTPLEKLTQAVAWSLDLTPSSRPLAGFLNGRSQGIKDLGVDNPGANDARAVDAWPDRASPVRYHLIGGVVTSDPSHPVGAMLGDLVVRPPSSTSGTKQEPTHTVLIGGVHHAGLLNHPTVVDQVLGWLASAAAVQPSARTHRAGIM
jgi:pimeloyl-ACP methyl ester carboxylesterase